MDDHKSRQQIDELADLYLTGVIEEADKQVDPPADNPVEGPAPIRLSPKTGSAASATPTRDDAADAPHSINEPEDRHPVLRLTDSENDETSPKQDDGVVGVATGDAPGDRTPAEDLIEPAPQAMLEAVLLGNLPGMSGPWLTQYAQLIAQSEGPVALLHVGEDAIDLELIEPRIEAEPAPAASTTAVRIPPMRGNKTGLVGLLDALTRSETAPTRTVLVRLDSVGTAQTLSRFAAIEDWTLLCGVDDASVAGAAQQINRLIHADPRLADRHVGVMVMGSDESTARAAADRVARNVGDDLVHHVQFIGHLKRMQPVQVRELGSFPDPVAVWPQLVAWFDTLEAPELEPVLETVIPEPAPTPKTPTQPAARETKPQRLSEEAVKLGPLPQQPPASRPALRPVFTATPPRPAAGQKPKQPATQPPEPAQPAASTAPAAPQPKPRPHSTPSSAATAPVTTPTRPAPQPRVLAPQPELDLIALLAQGPAALDNPTTLDARIPDQPDTQLAVDAQGVVHILAKTVSDTFDGDDAASPDPRQSIMQLIEAGRWVREHLELLALTQRDRDFIDTDPVLHLLTDRADLTTRLVGKLAGQVKLHLLQQVQLGRESGWFCTPLG